MTDYVAKTVSAQVSNDQYELFVNETVTDVDGKEVVIPRSQGVFTETQLEAQKANYQSRIDEVDAKLSAIAAIENAS